LLTQTFSFTHWTPTPRSTQPPARCSKLAAPRSKPLLPFSRARRDFFPDRVLHVLPVPTHTLEELLRLLRRCPVTGGDIFDLQILATMNVNGIQRIYTFNTADFISFPEIAVLTP